jgi:hypothetical protein
VEGCKHFQTDPERKEPELSNGSKAERNKIIVILSIPLNGTLCLN